MASHVSQVLCYPMHGEIKVVREGSRTRDGHLIDWFGKLAAVPVKVFSRPEPWPRLTLARLRGAGKLPSSATWCSPERVSASWLLGTKSWWVRSAEWYSPPAVGSAVIMWNPLLGLNRPFRDQLKKTRSTFDLLDDWTAHHDFRAIGGHVDRAYAALLDSVENVTANSEGTYELAVRYGRPDAAIITNGCDPETFSTESTAYGPTTIGYAGKIGQRLDRDLIEQAARALPDCRFVFAGPIINSGWIRPLRHLQNIEFIGDVHYEGYPRLLQSFDIAWVPHRVGDGEIGGDVIKVYEYRAAGLPTVSTRIIGSDRAPKGVSALDRDHVVGALRALTEVADNDRVPRDPTKIPTEMTWQYKARVQLGVLAVI